MSAAHKHICIVPARGGSKGIPKKNLAELGKAPLLAWPIRIALATPLIDAVYVSTDCEEIADVGRKEGAQILMRPAELSGDTSTVVSMIHHHLGEFEREGRLPETIIYLEPTSPFRTPEEILQCHSDMMENDLDSVATFASLAFHPTWLLSMDEEQILTPRLPDEDAWNHYDKERQAYALTGGAYVFRVSSFREKNPPGIYFGERGHIIQTSFPVDIDTPLDLSIARLALPLLHNNEFRRLGLK